MSWKDHIRFLLITICLSSRSGSYFAFFMTCFFNTTDFSPLSVTVVWEIISCHTAVSSIAIMQSMSYLFLCFNWRIYEIYDIILSVICSGVFCAWVVRWRRHNPFRGINLSSHPWLARKSFIWTLLAAFSFAYILAFLWISFRDTCKFFDLCKVIHSKSISSKSVSLIFPLPRSSFFAKLPRFF